MQNIRQKELVTGQDKETTDTLIKNTSFKMQCTCFHMLSRDASQPELKG